MDHISKNESNCEKWPHCEKTLTFGTMGEKWVHLGERGTLYKMGHISWSKWATLKNGSHCKKNELPCKKLCAL